MSLNKAMVGSLDKVRVGWILDRVVEVEADTTQITILGLDILRHHAYMLILNFKNPTGSATEYRLFVEEDLVATNYYRQYLFASGTSVSANRANDSMVHSLLAGGAGIAEVLVMRDVDGVPRFTSTINREDAPTIYMFFTMVAKTAPVSNITRLDIVATVTNSIGAGSKIYLFRMGG